jgi:hypothetical protein
MHETKGRQKFTSLGYSAFLGSSSHLNRAGHLDTDLYTRLVWLSAYMGHVNIVGTGAYFERHCCNSQAIQAIARTGDTGSRPATTSSPDGPLQARFASHLTQRSFLHNLQNVGLHYCADR